MLGLMHESELFIVDVFVLMISLHSLLARDMAASSAALDRVMWLDAG